MPDGGEGRAGRPVPQSDPSHDAFGVMLWQGTRPDGREGRAGRPVPRRDPSHDGDRSRIGVKTS